MRAAPFSSDREEERRLQDERIRGLSGEPGHGSGPRGFAGFDASADF